MIDKNFWHGKKIFVTGHSGFKGSWLSIWLLKLGAKLKGYSLEPNTDPSIFNALNLNKKIESDFNDIRNFDELKKSIVSFKPDILFHMAAQPLVRDSYKNPIYTFETNTMGTLNVLEACKYCKNLESIIIVTTDKCYENDETARAFVETDSMGGKDPYSASKGCAELVTSSYKHSFLRDLKKGISTVRAGNVIGGGDWSKDRLIPDILRCFEEGKKLSIRNPDAVRPWQYVLEPLSGYLILAQNLHDDFESFSSPFNFGPEFEDSKSVEWIVKKMSTYWPESEWEINNNKALPESQHLTLNADKAKKLLKWIPKVSLNESLDLIFRWHSAYKEDQVNMFNFSLDEIREYESKLR
jgi:CDP-glucose 4,6-dehydratase